MTEAGIAGIIRKGRGRMPSFSLPAEKVQALAHFVQSLNPAASALSSSGDANRGESIFFGEGQCSSCHMVRGRGSANGPDLSSIAKTLSLTDLTRALTDPGAHVAEGYGVVSVEMNNGETLRGFARAQGSHDLVLQTSDGRLHLLDDREYRRITPENRPAMPAYNGSTEQQQDLLAYLSRLDGTTPGPLTAQQKPITQAAMGRITHPKLGDWPTYNGNLNGNRYSVLDQVNLKTVSRLQLAWTYSLPFFGLETTPLVFDGVMYVTGNNQVYALSGKTGREIWRYSRPKSTTETIAGDARIGVNRGVAVLGSRVFYITDNAHLLALNRLTGALLWDVDMPEEPQHYGGTAAPLIVGDLVIAGVSGGDQGIRGFVAAYHAATGRLAWRHWTIPKPGEPGSETWKGSALKFGGGSTWLTGTFDPEANVLYWGAGNPYPDTDGDQRLGRNLYTDSVLALDPKTGDMLWYFQFTPHDLHDWDASEPIVLVDTEWKGTQRKLLLQANRNGFLYVLDRKTGKPLLASKLVDRLNWATEINDADWTPELLPADQTSEQGVKTCPAVRGATNWYSTAYSPLTRLYYVMTVEDCSMYRKAQDGGYGRVLDPADPPQKILRAFNIETGKTQWQLALPGQVNRNYSGVLATAGGLVFFGGSDGGFSAADAGTGRYLWHFDTNQAFKASPMTYEIDGKQYIAIASGANILSFELAE